MCQAGAWCKISEMEGVVGQSSLTEAWGMSRATWASHFLPVGVCFFILYVRVGTGQMIGGAAGLEITEKPRRALSRGKPGVGTAERCWRETEEAWAALGGGVLKPELGPWSGGGGDPPNLWPCCHNRMTLPSAWSLLLWGRDSVMCHSS